MATPIFGKFAAFVIGGTLAMGVAAPSASAAPAGSVDALVSGPFIGTTSWTFATAGCDFVHQVFDGTYGTHRKPAGSFHLEGCIGLDGLFSYVGTFTVQAKGHTTVTGTVSGTVNANMIPCAPLNFALAVTGGTGRLAGSSGSITLRGSWCGTPGAIEPVNEPISGELVASLTNR
jgi:hypothetical protein